MFEKQFQKIEEMNIDNDLDFDLALKERIETMKEKDYLLTMSISHRDDGMIGLNSCSVGDISPAVSLLHRDQLRTLNDEDREHREFIRDEIILIVSTLCAEDVELRTHLFCLIDEIAEELGTL